MRTYLFRTRVTMKAYNYTKWYILPDIVNDFETDAETLAEALKKYREHVQKTAYIDISKTALKRKRECLLIVKTGPQGKSAMLSQEKQSLMTGTAEDG